jgi:hypothetical protein
VEDRPNYETRGGPDNLRWFWSMTDAKAQFPG